ncbi:MAG: hypothetical protein WAQ05_21485, partial [Rubrivivax sp.]
MPTPADNRRPAAEGDSRHQLLRRLGAQAHQLRATTRAADHFVALGVPEDRDTGSWLMSSAVDLAAEVAQDIDGLARGLKEAPADAGFGQVVQKLRVRAHQLHAAARAADHFMDLDSRDDRETAGWLIATARTLADRLAAEIDDGAGGMQKQRPVEANVIDANDAGLVRRVA